MGLKLLPIKAGAKMGRMTDWLRVSEGWEGGGGIPCGTVNYMHSTLATSDLGGLSKDVLSTACLKLLG